MEKSYLENVVQLQLYPRKPRTCQIPLPTELQSQRWVRLAAQHSHNHRMARCILVNAVHRLAVVALLISTSVLPAAAKKKPPSKINHPKKAEIEAATRLQVFIDRANFTPGR